MDPGVVAPVTGASARSTVNVETPGTLKITAVKAEEARGLRGDRYVLCYSV